MNYKILNPLSQTTALLVSAPTGPISPYSDPSSHADVHKLLSHDLPPFLADTVFTLLQQQGWSLLFLKPLNKTGFVIA